MWELVRLRPIRLLTTFAGRKCLKAMIPKECRIGDTFFTSLATIGGNLYTRHVNNLNHVHKNGKDLLLVIIILVTDVNGAETVFL